MSPLTNDHVLNADPNSSEESQCIIKEAGVQSQEHATVNVPVADIAGIGQTEYELEDLNVARLEPEPEKTRSNLKLFAILTALFVSVLRLSSFH